MIPGKFDYQIKVFQPKTDEEKALDLRFNLHIAVQEVDNYLNLMVLIQVGENTVAKPFKISGDTDNFVLMSLMPENEKEVYSFRDITQINEEGYAAFEVFVGELWLLVDQKGNEALSKLYLVYIALIESVMDEKGEKRILQ